MKTIVAFFTPPGCQFGGLEDLAKEVALCSGGNLDTGTAHGMLVMAGITAKAADALVDYVYQAIDQRMKENSVNERSFWKAHFAQLVGREFVPTSVQPIAPALPEQREIHVGDDQWVVYYIQKIDKPKRKSVPLIMFARHRQGSGFTIMTDKKHELVWGMQEMVAGLSDGFYVRLNDPLIIHDQDQVVLDKHGCFWLIPPGEDQKPKQLNLPACIIFDKIPDGWFDLTNQEGEEDDDNPQAKAG